MIVVVWDADKRSAYYGDSRCTVAYEQRRETFRCWGLDAFFDRCARCV